MPAVRLVLVDTNKNPTEAVEPFYISLFVKDDGSVIDTVRTYGHWGKMRSNDVWPFILRPLAGSGEADLDFGESAESESNWDDRHGWTNLPSKKIVVGEYVTARYFGSEYVCRIGQVNEQPENHSFIAAGHVAPQ